MKNKKTMIFGSAALLAAVIPSCKMPPKQAWSQIQSDGLASYMGAAPMERQVAQQSRAPERAPRTVAVSQGQSDWLRSFLGTPAGQIRKPDATKAKPRANTSIFGNSVAKKEPARSGPRPSLFGSATKKAKGVPGQPGYVYTPYAEGKMVDVTKFNAGQKVRCPHTGRLFAVPDFSAPATPSVIERPRIAVVTEAPRRRIRDRESTRQRLRVAPPREEPKPRVEVARTEKPAPAPEPEIVAPVPRPQPKPDSMTAQIVPGRANQVYSPYANENQIVDITGMKPGDKARCPYTDRVFIVPGGSKPAASTPTAAVSPQPKPVTEKKVTPPKEKPAPAPQPTLDPDPKPTPAPAPAPKPEATGGGGTPTAGWSGKSGYAKSPFGGHLVDVSGKPAGAVVRCPFSGKQFKVPAGSN